MGCASSASQQRRSPGQAVIASLRGELLRPIDALAQTPGKVLIVSGVLAPAGALPLCAPLSAAPSFYVGLCVKELVWYTHRTDETFGQGVVEDRERWEVRYSEVLTGHVVIQDPADSAVRVLVKIAPGKYSFDAVTKKTAVEVKSGQPHPPGFKVRHHSDSCVAFVIQVAEALHGGELRVLDGALEVRGGVLPHWGARGRFGGGGGGRARRCVDYCIAASREGQSLRGGTRQVLVASAHAMEPRNQV